MNEHDLSKTVFLPKTKFPMKANLVQNEPTMIEYWQKNSIYKSILNDRSKEKNVKKFTLHDGPPYANGNFHVGHALNKILKDIINKYHIINGYYVEYIPGWDCHGLPIELATLKKFPKTKFSTSEIRSHSREYAKKHIILQAEDQTRMGIFWDNSDLQKTLEENTDSSSFYYTMSPFFEVSILQIFYQLFEKNLIYKAKKPIHWCCSCATALAEAEVEYAQHKSLSIYVKFPVNNKAHTYVVIWTTTPWTLPANLAVCFNESLSYSEYQTSIGNLILADGREKEFFKTTGLSYTKKETIHINEIKKLEVRHPFLEQKSMVILGDHVTLDAGTGIVHTAPGHGQDDYQIGLKYELEPYSPVNIYGKYTKDFALLEGTFVFKANAPIIEILESKNLCVYTEEIEHSYPHCWRCRKPIIFQATEQWFFAIHKLKEQALEYVKNAQWFPQKSENRFMSMIQNRPDWCLSRQRAWGVPIPAFVCKNCGGTLMTKKTLKHLVEIVKKEGIEVWFDQNAKDLLPENTSCAQCNSSDFIQEQNILDVWFDSGITWDVVLKNNHQLNFPADVYLEGSDQHRGWFQSSFWPCLALNGHLPYKKVVTHGYVLDDKGRAMSKSLGNVISPSKDVIPKYGADVLRLWVCSEDFTTDNTIGYENLNRISDTYRKIRNSFRYMLGNLNDTHEFVPNEKLIVHELDLWVLHELSIMEMKFIEAYENYEIHDIFQKIQQFITITLSHKYFDIIRDSLYCNHSKCKTRQSHIQTLWILLYSLCVWMSPVLSFTMEEVYQTILSKQKKSVFQNKWPSAQKWKNNQIQQKFDQVWEVKNKINILIEKARNESEIKSSMQVIVKMPQKEISTLGFSKEELESLFIISFIEESDHQDIKIAISDFPKCPRCWQHKKIQDQLCKRCEEVVGFI